MPSGRPPPLPNPVHTVLPLPLLFLYPPTSLPLPLARADSLVLNSPHLFLPVRDPPPAQSPLVPAESTGREWGAGRSII